MHRNHQDFESDGAYDDYLEEVEDLIFRWVNVNADEASEQLERQSARYSALLRIVHSGILRRHALSGAVRFAVVLGVLCCSRSRRTKESPTAASRADRIDVPSK